ncbi:unnamed protein product [Trichobilharzia szidati]|nr:unnamed protein product [Trichobilharzia szidati]
MKRNNIFFPGSSKLSLNSRVSTRLSDMPVYQSKQSRQSRKRSLWSETKHFLSIKEIFQPIMNIFPTVDPKHSVSQFDFWTKFTKSPNAIGHIHFSLRYACTLRTLNVVISHLTGISNFEKSFTAFPSQVESTFVIALRLQQNRKNSINRDEFQDDSDGLSRSYFTLPVRTSSNPHFDQSFVFPVTLNELRNTELVLTVMHVISTDECSSGYSNIEESLILSEALNSLTSQQPDQSSQISLHSRQIPEEMKCIGVAFYRVDHEKLVHYPEELLHVWQELFKPLDNEDFTYLDKSTREMKPISPKEHWKPIESNNQEQISVHKAGQVELASKPMVELSLRYIKQSSQLEVHLEKIKYIKLYTNETELIFRAIFCLKSMAQQSLKSQPIEIVKIDDNRTSLNTDAKDSYIVDQITIPSQEHLSLDVDMDYILHYKDIQTIFEIFFRTNSFCQARCLTRIVLGSNAINTKESAMLQWNDLITEVNKLRACNSLNSTRKITYWHEIDKF